MLQELQQESIVPPLPPLPTISKPNYIYVGTQEMEEEAKRRYKPVVDVSSSSFKPSQTVFKVFGKNERNRSIELVPTPELLCTKYFSQKMILSIVHHSNKYREDRMKKEPNLDIWKKNRQSMSKPFTVSCVYQFLAIIYYMGIVALP